MGKSRAAGLYDEDFFEWTQRNAELLRRGKPAEADLEHIAEEIEDMGKRDRREAVSRTITVLSHLLKWKLQPNRRSGSWEETIRRERRELELIFDQSASIKNYVLSCSERIMKDAARDAAGEMRCTVAASDLPSWTLEQVLDHDFWPE